MADHDEVFSQIKKYLNVSYPVLVPNLTGLNNAVGLRFFTFFANYCLWF